MVSKVSDPRVIVSLDFAGDVEALALAKRLDPAQCRLKIGKELFTAAGPGLVRELVADGYGIFLDLKYHDIPNTVASACSAAAGLGVWMMNLHASGGLEMMKAARDALDRFKNRPLLIAVTVLTSMDNAALAEIGIDRSPKDQVLALARLAKSASLDGVVCSARESSLLRETLGRDFRLVTPGIRPLGSSRNDQKRVMTPRGAILAGSDYLVIGRPITRADDPAKALSEINEEISSVISE